MIIRDSTYCEAQYNLNSSSVLKFRKIYKLGAIPLFWILIIEFEGLIKYLKWPNVFSEVIKEGYYQLRF